MSAFRDQRAAGNRVLPTWMFLLISILCFMGLVGMGFYEIFLRMGLGVGAVWLVAAYAVVATMQVSMLVGGTLVMVYLFNWLQEVRRTLKQIDENTRHLPPTGPPGSVSVGPSPLAPSDYKYMPKH